MKNRMMLTTVSAAFAAVPQCVAAQAAPSTSVPAPAAQGVSEIIVTANRREQRLQDVPTAITALPAVALERSQITDVSSIQRLTPSLNVRPFPGDPTHASISLRGIISNEALPTIDPAVGLYLDGVYIARSPGANLALVDIDRVEVLRGPQGTLFGRNTIGGAINIVPKRPVDKFEGSIEGTYGNYNLLTLSGVLNLPVAQGVALRIVGQHSQHDGYAKSLLSGRDLNDQNSNFIRAQLSIDLNDNWNLLIGGDYTRARNHGQWVTLVYGAAQAATYVNLVSGGTDSIARYVDPYTRRTNAQPFSGLRAKLGGGVSVLTGKLGGATFKNIFSYRALDRRTNNDLDGTPYSLSSQTGTVDTQHQYSEEVQLFGKIFQDRLDWIIGGYYFLEKSHDLSFSPTLFPQLSTTGVLTEGNVRNASGGAFAQGTFALTDRLRLTGGIRFTKDTRNLVSFNRRLNSARAVVTCGVNTAVAPICTNKLPTAKYRYFPFTVGADYRISPTILAYGKYSQGYRSGGFNLRGTTLDAVAAFDPEKLGTYEIGFKSDLLDRHLRVNAALYRSSYDDIQLTVALPVLDANGNVIAQAQSIRNAGSARINGAELESTVVLGAVTLSGTFGYVNPKYTKVLQTAPGVRMSSHFIDSPKYTVSISGEYALRTPLGGLVIAADYDWRSKTYFAPVPPANPLLSRPAFGLLNARATLNVGTSGLEVAVFGRNILDKRYLQSMIDFTPVGFIDGFPGDPATYGVSLKYRF